MSIVSINHYPLYIFSWKKPRFFHLYILYIFFIIPLHNIHNDEGDVGISTTVVPADMNKPYLLVLDRTALTKQSLSSLVSAFTGKPLITVDLSTSMEHRIVVPPRKRKNPDYCVSITTERFPISWSKLAARNTRRGVSSVVLEPVEKARLASLPGRDVLIASIRPHADELPPEPSYEQSAFVESSSAVKHVSLGRAGASKGSNAPRATKDGAVLTYPVGQRPSDEQLAKPMFMGIRDEPIRPLNLGNMSKCWQNAKR